MPVSAPSDRRFRRAHVTPARKQRFFGLSWWKAGRAALLLAFLLYVGYRATRDVLNAEALTITRITVSGNLRLSKGEVVALLDGIRGTNMLTVDLESWRQKVLASPPMTGADLSAEVTTATSYTVDAIGTAAGGYAQRRSGSVGCKRSLTRSRDAELDRLLECRLHR